MSESSLLFIQALTSLHPGSGSAMGVVDLPVQRERHTQYPVIPGSSLKGVHRDAFRRALGEKDTDGENLITLFGSAQGEAEHITGALSISDARLLFFPVRSFAGVFSLATCPAVLRRFARDLALCGIDDMPDVPAVEPSAALVTSDSRLRIGSSENRLLLEEFEFEAQVGGADEITSWLAENGPSGFEADQVAIIHDDQFGYFTRYATEVTARVGLDYELKTVKKGALFYEELLPPETVFYSMIFAEQSRYRQNPISSADILNLYRNNLPAHIQIGANETTGKGLCALKLL